MVMDKDWEIKFQQEVEAKKARIQEILADDELLDDDGYPTDGALEVIKLWHWDDVKGWFSFIESIWHLRSWGWSEGLAPHDYEKDREVYRYEISTAGWSGNESIIYAMKENHMMWSITWVQSRRGGHYIFEGEELQ